MSPFINNFTDTATLLNKLDLLITVDTAIAHLGGALGKPTWLLLSYTPDFRWLEERSDTPWYQSIRLYRQRERGHWGDVIDDVHQTLLKYI